MRKSVWMMSACGLAFGLMAAETNPVPEPPRGHENIEWSIGYAFHLTDGKKGLPRVLLVGDSICNGYQGAVQNRLDGKVNVSYWVSSYCLTSPNYLTLLAFYLDEAKYDVIHFNNGLHSLETPDEAWAAGLKAAFALIRRKQPQAKLIWCSSTPLKDADKTEKVKRLNALAAKETAALGVATDDLFALLDPLDRAANWSDVYHHTAPVREKEADQVAKTVLSALTPASR